MKQKAGIWSVLLALFMMLLAPGMAQAQAPKAEGLSYIALGDSLAAGQTPYRTIGSGYADFLGKKLQQSGYLGTWTKQYAKSGAKSNEVLLQAQAAAADLAKADLVTIHAGANDVLGYVLGQVRLAQMTNTPANIDAGTVGALITGVGTNIAHTVQTVRTANPEAKVLVLGYYNALPYYPQEQQQLLLPILAALNSAIGQAAAATGAVYVDISTPFGPLPTAYLPNPLDIHPNEAGYGVMTDTLWSIIQPSLPAMKANRALNKVLTMPLTSTSEIADALSLTLEAKQLLRLAPAGSEKTAGFQKLDTVLQKLDKARKGLRNAA